MRLTCPGMAIIVSNWPAFHLINILVIFLNLLIYMINKVILVGHSMSGMVISQVAEKLPHKIERLIYLSAYLPRHQQSLFDLIASNSAASKPAPIEKAMQLSADKRSCLIAPEKIAPLFYNRCPEDKRNQLPKSFPAQAVLPLIGKSKPQ